MQTIRELIDRLVGFDTVSHHSNLALIEYVQHYLHHYGIESHLVPDNSGKKANLYATIGPAVDGGFALSGHTDVVPVDGQAWSHDPFTVVEKNNRLYGRGTSDMKSFIAIALAKVPQLVKQPLSRPLHIALSYDEEIGCHGAPALVDAMGRYLPAIQGVIVGEPTSMEVATIHKGVRYHRTQITGLAAHSSKTNLGVSANFTAAKLITFLDQVAEALAQSPQRELSGLEPPHSTISIGTLHGGIAPNIIPEQCEFVWDLRNVPKDDPQQILQRYQTYSDQLAQVMQQKSSQCGITTEVIANAPSLNRSADKTSEQVCCHLLNTDKTIAVSYGTEAGIFQAQGYSTVVCGPGSIDQAHTPDEYITWEQIHRCDQFIDALVQQQLIH